MPTEPERNDVAEKRNMISPTVYEQRAGGAIRALIGGPHADKLTARAFGCSVRMAQHLRQGRHWTIQRLTQASAILGVAFDAALYSPVSSAEFNTDTADFNARLALLEARFEEMVRGGDAGLARGAEAGAAASSGTDGERPRSTPSKDGGHTAQRQGAAVADQMGTVGRRVSGGSP